MPRTPSLMTPIYPPRTTKVVAIATWGIITTTALLVSAVLRLTPLAPEPLTSCTMTSFQWTLYVGWALFNGYVEGYRVYAEDDGVTTVTGEYAHAWVEVYLNGVGWVAYDPTPGRDDAAESGNATEPDQIPEPTPSQEPSPEPTDDASANVENPTPSPNPDDQPTTDPTSDPTMIPTENPHTLPDQNQKSGRWLSRVRSAPRCCQMCQRRQKMVCPGSSSRAGSP